MAGNGPVDHDDAMDELAALAGTTPERLVITDDLLKRVAVVGLAELFYKARRGCFQSAKYLVDRHLGTPDPDFLRRLHSMSGSEVREALLDLYRQQGHAEDEAHRLVELAERSMEEETQA